MCGICCEYLTIEFSSLIAGLRSACGYYTAFAVSFATVCGGVQMIFFEVTVGGELG